MPYLSLLQLHHWTSHFSFTWVPWEIFECSPKCSNSAPIYMRFSVVVPSSSWPLFLLNRCILLASLFGQPISNTPNATIHDRWLTMDERSRFSLYKHAHHPLLLRIITIFSMRTSVVGLRTVMFSTSLVHPNELYFMVVMPLDHRPLHPPPLEIIVVLDNISSRKPSVTNIPIPGHTPHRYVICRKSSQSMIINHPVTISTC